MHLPVTPPVAPMLAKLTPEIPRGDYLYEPKWDGFRCIVFRDRNHLVLQSRNRKPLNRYFPELVASLSEALPQAGVFDGEIVIAIDNHLDFEALLQRIHPADQRIRKLAKETPASFVAFDLLATEKDDLRGAPFSNRRQQLTAMLNDPRPPLYLTPLTDDHSTACIWFEKFEAVGLDGIIAKSSTLPYAPGKRQMLKIKHQRTADCVVGGYRHHKAGEGVGSLLLGLYDSKQSLQHVGIAAGFSAAQRRQLHAKLTPLTLTRAEPHPWAQWQNTEAHELQRLPGGESRWSSGKDAAWTPVKIELVAEVAYDYMQGERFRHATRFVRWRPDRQPASCTYAQLDRPARSRY